uniref:Uncharacterized protein n=2 Tax=Opuntia streptacantha TaxID=393608 RepID=A0A7C9DRP8_OPUST
MVKIFRHNQATQTNHRSNDAKDNHITEMSQAAQESVLPKPPGFGTTEVEVHSPSLSSRFLSPRSPCSEVEAPPGFSTLIGVTEGNNSFPPGVEDHAAKKVTVGGKGKAQSRKRNPGDNRRVTRSQLKKARTPIAGRRLTEPRKLLARRESIETTESMKQTAEEALNIGELLGVRVISHRENAVKRITDTIKANRAQRAKRS